jgi:ketosteroid isomerase-like protein
MKKLVAFGFAAALVPLAAFAFAPKAPPGPAAIEDMIRGLFKAADSGDRDTLKASIAMDSKEPVLCWDNGNPVAIKGAEATCKYLDGLMDSITKSKMKMTSKVSDIHAACESPTFGYATFTVAQTAAGPDGKPSTGTFWVTAIVTADKSDKWHIVHWHSSVAGAMASAAPK